MSISNENMQLELKRIEEFITTWFQDYEQYGYNLETDEVSEIADTFYNKYGQLEDFEKILECTLMDELESWDIRLEKRTKKEEDNDF